MWPEILKIFPRATLNVYANLEHAWCLRHFPQEMNQIKILIYQPGITCHGWVKSAVLNEAWRNADLWFYPCIFQETFCHTALQAAASRTLAITSDLAALQNTVGTRGWMLSGDPHTAEWRRTALETLQNLTPETVQARLDVNESWALAHSWRAQADKLLSWVDAHPYEYRGKYIDQTTVEKILIHGSNDLLQILEIGTYTGMSLIHLMRSLPLAQGTVIDSWKNSIECPDMKHLRIRESFKRNVERAGLTSRITVHRGESQKKLSMLLAESCTYDIILVDGNHYALDTFANLILAWGLLAPGGKMMIDNYNLDADALEYEYPCAKALAVPKPAVDRFLELYATELVVLHRDSRVFLEKKEKCASV
jgi:predicted O-methyltransferase YrrM